MMPHIAKNISESICKMLIGKKRQALLPTFRANTILPPSPYAKWKTVLTLPLSGT
jgi:hypothetical protein